MPRWLTQGTQKAIWASITTDLLPACLILCASIRRSGSRLQWLLAPRILYWSLDDMVRIVDEWKRARKTESRKAVHANLERSRALRPASGRLHSFLKLASIYLYGINFAEQAHNLLSEKSWLQTSIRNSAQFKIRHSQFQIQTLSPERRKYPPPRPICPARAVLITRCR